MFQILFSRKPFFINQFQIQTTRLASNITSILPTEKNGTKYNTLAAKEVPRYDTEQLVRYLQNKEYIRLMDTDFDILRKNRITGHEFFNLTTEDLIEYGMKHGPAKRITKFIKKSKNSDFTACTFTNLIIDNSNLFIEGKFSVAKHEKLGSFDWRRNSQCFNNLCIDYGKLLATVQGKRKLGSAPIIVGTYPPSKDSLWKYIQEQGYDVTAYDQNSDNYEKKHMKIGSKICEFVHDSYRNPGILVLIADNRDYSPVLKAALNNGWVVEVWFWNKGMFGSLKEQTHFIPLDNYYKSFAFGYGPNPSLHKPNKILEITGNIGKWTNNEIMEFFIPLKVFAWWNRINEKTIHLYFNNKKQMELTKHQLEKSSYNIQVKVKKHFLYKLFL